MSLVRPARGRRPLVAVTSRPRDAGDIRGWNVAGAAVQATYVEALWRAGATEAVVFPRPLSDDEAEAYLERVDGLLLVGGGDVDPSRYGQHRVDEVYDVRPASDGLELALASAAVRIGVPLLAVCRGMQVVNVAMGGTLHQHLPRSPGVEGHGRSGVGPGEHRVDVVAGSLLAGIVGGAATIERCWSFHHQAIDRLGDGLSVSGRSPDGIIEAVELERSATHPFVLGVQWHAERTAADDPTQQAVFDAFVDACSARSR